MAFTSDGLHVAIAGATGAVGQEFLQILTQRAFPVASLRLMASARSAGSTIPWTDAAHDTHELVVEDLASADFTGVDVAFFSAGSEQAAQARRAAAEGALVVDNSSAFRMDPDVPLVVPEVNAEAGRAHRGIIANPNCSTIILVVVLAPLLRHVGIRRVVLSTYQAVSGSGAAALAELDAQADAERAGRPLEADIYPAPIHGNVIPFVQAFGADDITTEEWKMVRETRRILEAPELPVSATCVRVPVRRAHSEAVNIEFDRVVSPDEVRAWLADAPGVQVIDEPATLAFPTPRDAQDGDDVLVGRIRHDPGHPQAIDLWLTGDQLRKGAALNAVQIAEAVLCGATPEGS
ncbi:MAG: aspartate-semialdehyde dehydrogenase [Planctomycetota bacterium]|nr:aspartate-semialdehyde dehydrogenase [Planctomycetota bacterium]